MRRILFAVLSVVACATVAKAGPPLSLTEHGHARAQSSLGDLYFIGQGSSQGSEEVLKWLRMGAEQGHAMSQFGLGLMYDKGQGVTQDTQEALKWYRKAAEQGYSKAQNLLGAMYAQGRGVPQKDQEALKWFRKAAEQGDAEGQYNLGVLYRDGQGIPQDFVRAHMWYSVSAATLSGVDLKKTAIKNRDDVGSRMTAEQIEKAKEMARRCQEAKFKECD